MKHSADEGLIRRGHWRAGCVTADRAGFLESDAAWYRRRFRPTPTCLVSTCVAALPTNRRSTSSPEQPYTGIQDEEQESRAVARKPRYAAAVLFGLRFADNIHNKFNSSQTSKPRLQSSKHNGAQQNLTQNGHSRSRVLESVERQWVTK